MINARRETHIVKCRTMGHRLNGLFLEVFNWGSLVAGQIMLRNTDASEESWVKWPQVPSSPKCPLAPFGKFPRETEAFQFLLVAQFISVLTISQKIWAGTRKQRTTHSFFTPSSVYVFMRWSWLNTLVWISGTVWTFRKTKPAIFLARTDNIANWAHLPEKITI